MLAPFLESARSMSSSFQPPILARNQARSGSSRSTPRGYRVYTARDIDRIPHLDRLPRPEREAMRAVAAVLPFRVNDYVVEELIDWSAIPQDPIFQLTFPQPGMLEPEDFSRMVDLVRSGGSRQALGAAAREVQLSLNPHPAGQKELNVPRFRGEPLDGVQHKYRETLLFFPASGQTCHAYCTYCFRWAQFAGLEGLKFAGSDTTRLVDYLREHREVTSVLITGGDPMVMKASVLRRCLEPLLDPSLEHIESIRIGTKAPAYWPQRFVTDPDADELLALFEHVRASGRHLALMAHYSHPRELVPPIAQEAVRRLQDAGTTVRCQAPDTSRCRWRALSRSIKRPTGASRVWPGPCAGPPCRRRPARSSWTASPRSAARSCSP
jgi:L-lysine 2,3-aminomutase